MSDFGFIFIGSAVVGHILSVCKGQTYMLVIFM